MMRTTLPDPFELEPSTAAYVPRAATAKALAEMQAAIERDDPAVLLRGPAGIGKTLLLRLLRRRVEGRMRCVELEADPADTADSLCAAALRELDRDTATAQNPVEELARVAGEFGRAGVLLEIDRAQRLGREALGPLVELAARCPMLQLVLAAELPEAEHAWLRSPDSRISVVELSEPMTPGETLEYLRARLELAVAPPEIRKKFGWWSGLRLIRESRGNPALLHHLARRVALGDAAGAIPETLRRRPVRARKGASRWWWIGATAAGAVALIATALWLYEPARNPPIATGGSRSGLDAPPAAEPEVAPVAEREPPRAALPPAGEAPVEPVAEEPPEVPASPEENLPGVQAAPPPPARGAPPPIVQAAPAPASVESQPERPESRPRTEPAPPAASPSAALASRAPAKAAPQEAPTADIPEVPAPAPASAAAPETVSLGAGDALARPSDLSRTQRAQDGIPVFINAVPSARIEIDGREVGRTPIVGLPIAPGERRFVARFADGRRVERTIRVEGSEVYVLFP